MKISLSIIILLLSTSFVFATPFLNEINVLKSTVVYSISGLLSSFIFYRCIFVSKFQNQYKITIIDLLAFALFINCTLMLINEKQNVFLLVNIFLYYTASRLLFISLQPNKLNNIINQISLIVPFVICTHILLTIAQKINVIPSFHIYFNNASTFGNPNMLGSYLAFIVPFCFIKSKKNNYFGIFVALFAICLMIAIQARTALLALFLCFFLWIILNKKVNAKFFVILLSIILALVLLAILIYWHPPSVYGRFFIWYLCILMIIKQPFGWGAYAFEKHIVEFQASYLSVQANFTSHISYDIVHSPFNEFLFIGVNYGIISLFLYIFLVIAIFWFAHRTKSQLIYPLLVFFTISLTYFPFKIAPLVILIIPIIALISTKSNSMLKYSIKVNIHRIILCILLLLSSYSLIYEIRTYIDYKKWQKAVIYSREKCKTIDSKEIFNNLYPKMNKNARFLITYSNLIYIQGNKTRALELLEQAENYYCDIVFSLKLAKLYQELGYLNKAESKYTLAENIAPDRFMASYEKILFYIDIGQYEKAYKLSRELYQKPIKDTIYADPYIIKVKIKRIMNAYERGESLVIFGNK